MNVTVPFKSHFNAYKMLVVYLQIIQDRITLSGDSMADSVKHSVGHSVGQYTNLESF